jgi:hypothetical protein
MSLPAVKSHRCNKLTHRAESQICIGQLTDTSRIVLRPFTTLGPLAGLARGSAGSSTNHEPRPITRSYLDPGKER